MHISELPSLVEGHLLWPDGTLSVDPERVQEYIFKLSARGEDLSKLFVTSLNDDVKAYNEVSDHPLRVKSDSTFSGPPPWSLPEHYVYSLVVHQALPL